MSVSITYCPYIVEPVTVAPRIDVARNAQNRGLTACRAGFYLE
jgi:hypothetical protein